MGNRTMWSVKQRKRRAGRVTRAGAGAIRIGSAVGAAMTNRRVLGLTEVKTMGVVRSLLLCLSVVFAVWPKWIGIPVGVLGAWLAVSLLIRGYKLYLIRRREMGTVVHETDRQDAVAQVRTKEGKGGV